MSDTEDIQNNELEAINNKFDAALKDTSSYRNCAGFVTYMLGIREEETLIPPKELAEKLIEVGRIELDAQNSTNISEEEYLKMASSSQAVSVLVNVEKLEEPKTLEEIVNNVISGPIYVHFAFIDPEDKKKVYARPDIEKKPSHTEWKNILNGIDEFKDMSKYLVFFNMPTQK
ncbi:MAG: hypothetical protein AB9915_02980 [Candidatus Dojkabacteria bacterium]